jgi:hypothetical protein
MHSPRVGLSVGVVLLKPPSLIDGEPSSRIASRGSTYQGLESCWRRCYRDDDGRGVMPLSSHAGDGAVEATWPWCDVGVESC